MSSLPTRATTPGGRSSTLGGVAADGSLQPTTQTSKSARRIAIQRAPDLGLSMSVAARSTSAPTTSQYSAARS